MSPASSDCVIAGVKWSRIIITTGHQPCPSQVQTPLGRWRDRCRLEFGMTGVFLSVLRYDWCAPLSQPSSCMLVNHGPSQQSSKEEYKPWKWGATARYYATHAKTMLPTRKSVPRPSRLSDHTKADYRKETQTAVVWSCLPIIMSSQNHLARHSEREKKTRQTEEEVGRQHQGLDRPGARQSPRGQWKQGENGGNWLRNHLWCPNDSCS